MPARTASGERRDRPRRDLADATVRTVGNVNATPVRRDTVWKVQGRVRRPAAVAAEFADASARKRRDRAAAHLADPAVIDVSDINVAARVYRNALRAIEHGLRRRTPVAAVTADPVARDRRDGAGRHFADATAVAHI